MFRKIILPISAAVAALSFSACASSEKKTVNEPQTISVAVATDQQDSAIATPTTAPEIETVETWQGLLSTTVADYDNCEILADSESAFKVKMTVNGTGTLTMEASVVNNAIQSILQATYKEGAPQEIIDSECKFAHKELKTSTTTISCEGNSITVSETDSKNIDYFRALSNGIKSACKYFKAKDTVDNLKSTQNVVKEPVVPVCDIDMDSNEWTFVQKGISEKIFFEGDIIKMIVDMSEDLGSVKSCQELIYLAILNKEQRGDIQCEGSIAKVHFGDTLKYDSKEESQKFKAELYKDLKKQCSTDESATESLIFQDEPKKLDEPQAPLEATEVKPAGEPPIRAKCKTDMESNLWTVEFEDVSEVLTYEFKGDVTKFTRETTRSFETPKDCADFVNTRTAKGEKYRCAGTIAYETLEETEKEGLTKESVMSQLKFHCNQ